MIIPILISLFFQLNNSQVIFCSVYCQPNLCTGTAQNQCTGCDTQFNLVGSECIPGGSYQISTTTNQFTTIPSTTTTCGPFTLLGTFEFNQQVTLTTINPITRGHFVIHLYMRVFLYDGWDQTLDFIYVEHNGQTKSYGVRPFSVDTVQNLCGGAGNQLYLKIQSPFNHTDTTSPVSYIISVLDTNQQKWAIDQYIIMIKACNDACNVCTDGTNTSCSACEAGYKLSGTICHTSCLSGYGETQDPLICVLCDTLCLVCFETSTNCSSCVTSGANQAFLYLNQCVVTCPDYYVDNVATHVCDRCAHQNCMSCLATDTSNCSQCDLNAYFLNQTCYNPCPQGYYSDARICNLCHPSCQICSGNPSPCTLCADGFYSLNDTCVSVCPDLYFAYQANKTCLLCQTHCVMATLDIGYNATADRVQADVCFTQPINFTELNYQSFQTISYNDSSFPLERLVISYEIISDYCYKVIISVPTFIRLDNLQVLADIIDQPMTDQYSLNGFKFNPNLYLLQNSTTWTYYKSPRMSDNDTERLSSFVAANDKLNEVLSMMWIQQIKKTGIFAFFLQGAQLSSTTILHDGTPPQNMYEAQRLIGTFIFFQVPRWEQNSSLTKYVFEEPIPPLLSTSESRLLQTTSSIQNWRFQRTGHSTYFLLDVYMPLILLAICWSLIILVKCCYSNRISTKYKSSVFVFVHKVHEITMFYFLMSTILQWAAYQNQNQMKHASLGASVIVISYLFAYEAYIFYHLLPFPQTQISSPKFNDYVQKYAFFLRDIRFEDYKKQKNLYKWNVRSLLRPYNYHIMGFYRLALVVVALPLFQGYSHACIICLLIIQLFQVIRYVFTWPYHAQWRNFFKLFLEINLLIIFIIYTNLSLRRQVFYLDANTITVEQIDKYYATGWAGFSFFIIYNALYLLYFIIDIVTGCYYTNQQRVQYGRRKYFKTVLNCFRYDKNQEEENSRWLKFMYELHGAEIFKRSQIPHFKQQRKQMLTQIILRGNLMEKIHKKLTQVTILIEECKIRAIDQGEYEIQLVKVNQLHMSQRLNIKDKVNIAEPQKIYKKIRLSRLNKQFFYAVDSFYSNLSQFSTDYAIVKTYLKVEQNKYNPGQKIPIRDSDMVQQTIAKRYGEMAIKKQLPRLMEGFPVPNQIIQNF